jgi:hypothetical protein
MQDKRSVEIAVGQALNFVEQSYGRRSHNFVAEIDGELGIDYKKRLVKSVAKFILKCQEECYDEFIRGGYKNE